MTMKQQAFEAHYAQLWQEFSGMLESMETNTHIQSGKQTARFTELYRKICHLQSLAMERNYSRILADELNDLVLRGYRQLYRRRPRIGYALLNFMFREFPQLVRKESKLVWMATAIFYLPALILFIVITLNPELIYGVFNSGDVTHFETMYDPGNKKFGAAREAETDLYMFGFYIKNNISVAFRTFALGLLWGIGSLFFLVYNGIILGAVAAHLASIGYHTTFFSFVIGHGAFELTAITLAGAAGLKLGYGLIRPGHHTRVESLRLAGLQAIKIMYGVMLMLIIAAFLEAYWSSSGILNAKIKYLVGTILWSIVLLYFLFAGRQYATR